MNILVETMETEMTKTFNEIAAEYAPYHTLPAFAKGAEDYMDSKFDCPFAGGVDGQAWDRGMEAAMRFTRQHGGRH
jgi:hypothetical protein